MQLQQIRYFLETVDRLHFGKSAANLGVSQPSLSRGIQLLERELGGRLLERRRSRMRLSALGQLVLPDLQAAAAILDQATDLAHALVESQRRAVSLVLSEEASHLLYTPALDGIGGQLRGERLKIDRRPQHEATAALLQGAYDIGLIADEGRPLGGVRFWRSRLVVAFPGGREAPVEGVALADLAREAFIVRDGKRFELSITAEMARNGLSREMRHRANDDQTQLLMFRENLGCIVVPEEQARALGIEAAPLRCETELAIALVHQPRRCGSPSGDEIARALAHKSNVAADACPSSRSHR